MTRQLPERPDPDLYEEIIRQTIERLQRDVGNDLLKHWEIFIGSHSIDDMRIELNYTKEIKEKTELTPEECGKEVADRINLFKKQLKKGIIEEWSVSISNVHGCVPRFEVVKPPPTKMDKIRGAIKTFNDRYAGSDILKANHLNDNGPIKASTKPRGESEAKKKEETTTKFDALCKAYNTYCGAVGRLEDTIEEFEMVVDIPNMRPILSDLDWAFGKINDADDPLDNTLDKIANIIENHNSTKGDNDE
jgi:hypothetical protein